jgi:hypothetical protein
MKCENKKIRQICKPVRRLTFTFSRDKYPAFLIPATKDEHYTDPNFIYAEKTVKYFVYPAGDGFTGWPGTYFKPFLQIIWQIGKMKILSSSLPFRSFCII